MLTSTDAVRAAVPLLIQFELTEKYLDELEEELSQTIIVETLNIDKDAPDDSYINVHKKALIRDLFDVETAIGVLRQVLKV